jgi:3-dehydroquinate synthase
MAASMEMTVRGERGSVSRIAFGPLSGLGSELDPSRTVIVTDAEIRRLYRASFPTCPVALVERGEAAKSLASLEALYGSFLELGLGRDGLVLAIGGGAISDLAGFAASTWLRGVNFGFAPTTLLAMVDAAVGGKNGVDFRGVKNLVGSFSQPRFVRMDVVLLDSLPDIEFASGMAEVVKHAAIAGGSYFELVEAAAKSMEARRKADPGPARPAGEDRSPRPSREELERIVAGSVEIKAGVVNRDERESGERRVLNLGHTVGHGVEAATGLPHGHSVAAGLGTACRLALSMGRLSPDDCDRITRLIETCGLPSSIGAATRAASTLRPGSDIADGPALRAAIVAAMAADKKRRGGEILMAIPEAIGSVAIDAVPFPELQAFVTEAP